MMCKLSDKNFKNTRSNLKIELYDEYKNNVVKKLKRKLKNGDNREWLKANNIEVISIYMLNFDSVNELLRSLYSKTNQGQEPKDPQSLLRSLILMCSLRETSITNWVKQTRSNSMIRLLCGFDNDRVPGIGTYYDFKKRLENGVFVAKCPHRRILPSELRIAKSKGYERARKSKPENKNIVKEPVIKKLKEEMITDEKEPLANDFEAVLNQILYLVAVAPSVEKGFIKESNNLTVAVDGSTIESGASHEGKKTCDCQKQGIYKCDCLRKFTDPDALWGYDNREKNFIWGYRFLQMVCADNRHDFPIYLSIASANTHEPLMAMKALDRFDKQSLKLQTTARIGNSSFDALFDQYHFYHYLVHKQINYAIPYAHPVTNPIIKGEIVLNDKGVPICKGGLAMRRITKNRQDRHVYCCPVKRPARRDGGVKAVTYREECPLAALCQPDTKYGPLVSVPSDIDPRVHPSIPRDSQAFRNLRSMRNCAERSNAFKKNVCGMNKKTTRSMSYAYIRLTLISIIEHSRVWARDFFQNIDLSTVDWLTIFQ